MIPIFAAVWLKLNVLLLLAFVLWQVIKWLAARCGQSLRFNAELQLARYVFLVALLAPVLLLVPDRLFSIGQQMPGLTVFAGQLSAGIDGSLARTLSVNSMDLSMATLFTVLLLTGLLIQIMQLTRRYRQLARLLAASTPFRQLHGVHIVFSAAVTTPFSTQALGRSQVVLPYQLLRSPLNLGLALKHELQHIRNGDLRWVLFLEFLKPLFFWNPAWYLWLNEFHCLQEYACDEALLGKPSVHAHEYGNCLLEVASHAATAPVWAASNMVPHFASFRSARSQLQRRILMLKIPREDRNAGLRVGLYACTLLLGFGCGVGSVLSAETQAQPAEYLPVITINPQYPAAALERKLIGWTQLMFDVDPDGDVSRIAVRDHCVVPQVFDASVPVEDNGCMAESDVFDTVAIAAMKRFMFKPRIVDGEAVVTRDVQYVFRFNLKPDGESPPVSAIQEQYKALRAQQ